MEPIRHGTNDVWIRCKEYMIMPDENSEFKWRAVPKDYLKIFNSDSPAADTARTLVLISPQLSNKDISRLLTPLKRNQITCGFKIDEAYDYERVIIVDPKSDFPDADLVQLRVAGIEVERVPPDGDLRLGLEKFLD